MEDTIDILMATYNGEQYIKEQLKSIENQTYKNWYLIISDDCSTDNTMSIIKEFKNQYPTKVNIIDNTKSSGSAKNNFFNLFKYSKNKYVACCDQDDVWLDNKLEIMYNALKEEEKQFDKRTPILVYSDLMVVDCDLNIIDKSFFDYSQLRKRIRGVNDLLIENSITGCAMMFNSNLKEYLLKPYNLDKIIMHDWLAGLVAYSFGAAIFINQPLVKYRQHGDNSVGANSPKKVSNLISNARKGFKFARNVIVNTYNQIEEFYRVNKLEIEDQGLSIIGGYAMLKNKNKIYRLYFYRKNEIQKIGFIRKVWLFVFG